MRVFINALFEPGNNGSEVAKVLVDLLYVNISQSTIKDEIEMHPNYPSLLSVSDTLNNYGIETVTAKFDHEAFPHLPIPFITQIKGKSASDDFFTIVKEIDTTSVCFLDPEKHQWTTVPSGNFFERCSEIVLLAEAGKNAGEPEYQQQITQERKVRTVRRLLIWSIPATLALISIDAIFQSRNAALLPICYSLLMLAGAFICILLSWYELDQYNPALQQICSFNKKMKCGAVLQSKGAKIFGISWSTLGLIYFTGGLTVLLTQGLVNPESLWMLSWLSLLASPYILYSVYYQWKVTRQWCILCLCIQVVIFIQCIVSLTAGWYNTVPFGSLRPGLFVQTAAGYILPAVALFLLIPVLQKAKEGKRSKIALQRLKRDPRVFESLLVSQKAITEIPAGLGIILGNPNATKKIIKVCNPYCGPCAKAHPVLEELLSSHPDIQIQIIFTATNREDDIRSHPVKHLLAISESNDQIKIKEALDNWYLPTEKDYEAFSKKYPMNGELEKQGKKIEAMQVWCDKADIQFTPTFFVNGFELPGMYSVKDLKYFVSA
jgi:uncharacterized membrane protein/thiol-disulfide isomerase/thioredoxin